ncbi:MAG TPA: hypothetical protein PLP21_02420 [Pyrinomonadaceae bacterium]|nr:hypothetical protein [Pyrinomonadaceae bacterium]
METESTQEIWHVEANGEVFETHFAQMTEWIAEGSLLRIDRVRKGDLRWIEAGKVPSLVAFFNAKDNGQPISPPVVTTTKLGPSVLPGSPSNPSNSAPVISSSISGQTVSDPSAEPVCCMHADLPAVFFCETCCNQFCRSCPNSYGGNVKICPFCGAMCRKIETTEAKPLKVYYPPVGKFGFGDFTEALAYPFKFKASLIMGAIMFMFLSIGQSVVSFGGIFMMWGAIVSFMLANTLTFGILANTVENFSQGKIGENFMPSFDNFSLWEDVVHPFFLMIGVYISSFGPLIALGIVAFFLIVAPIQKEINASQVEAMRAMSPGLPYAANAVKQSEKVREIVSKNAEQQRRRVEAIESGIEPDEDFPQRTVADEADEFNEKKFEELQQMIQESRKAQLESAIGKSPETVANERAEMIKQVISKGILLLLAGGLCLLWGLFYFPAASAVAGYTRSFGATLNPAVGLDTIRRLGFDYVKILAFGLLLAIASGMVGGVIGAILSPFDLPRVGNLPATAIGSLFGFYFSVVFSCVIGFALYKNAERLKLFR